MSHVIKALAEKYNLPPVVPSWVDSIGEDPREEESVGEVNVVDLEKPVGVCEVDGNLCNVFKDLKFRTFYILDDNKKKIYVRLVDGKSVRKGFELMPNKIVRVMHFLIQE